VKNFPLPRLDQHPEIRNQLLKYCRLQVGEIWPDPSGKHRVGCLDAANLSHIEILMAGEKATLAIHDPPYNLVAFEERQLREYINWCKQWIENTEAALAENSAL
jgi:site-specific DNA-methyltransferase (adenine-specific)